MKHRMVIFLQCAILLVLLQLTFADGEVNCPPKLFGYKCKFTCNCKQDFVCNVVTGTCPKGCKDGFWGPGCQLSNKCFYNGKYTLYMGTLNETKSGKPCQRFDVQSPHSHAYKNANFFPDELVPGNVCRSPNNNNLQTPWCYTTSTKRWQGCDIKNCECPRGRFGMNCEKECHCRNYGRCDSSTGKCDSGCDEGWEGLNCQARKNVNKCPKYLFGYKCRFACHCKDGWSCHPNTGECSNGCNDGFWGPGCQLLNHCFYNGKYKLYMGTMSKTKSGEPCQRFDVQSPHSHDYKNANFFPDELVPGNVCRSPNNNLQTPWCYTTSENRYQACDIKNCECPRGRFGLNCEKECHCRNDVSCDNYTGKCESGCDEGWEGLDCQARIDQAEAGPQSIWHFF